MDAPVKLAPCRMQAHDDRLKRRVIWLLSALLSFSFGFNLGALSDEEKRQKLEITNRCAHYDMDDGRFTWGYSSAGGR